MTNLEEGVVRKVAHFRPHIVQVNGVDRRHVFDPLSLLYFLFLLLL
jgi:hypothetical protein